MPCIEYIDYVYRGDHAFTAHHPFYKNFLQYPPEGYRFGSNPGLHLRFDNLEVAHRIASGRLKNAAPLGFHAYLAAFTDRCRSSGMSQHQIAEFLRSRPLEWIFSIPPEAEMVFVPTYPFYLAPNNWMIEIEDYTTLLYPFVHNGFTRDLEITSNPCFLAIKALFSLPNCKAIITHVRNTYDTLCLLFKGDGIIDKIKFVPIGFPMEKLSRERDGRRINVLFINSYHGGASHFFVRGGRELLEAFRIAAERYPRLHLTIRNPLPLQALTEHERRLVKLHPRITHIEQHLEEVEFKKLLHASDIFIIPAYRLHIISTVQALSYGMPVISSDGWGFSEFVEDGITGFLARGRYGVQSWIDEQGILRENYIDYGRNELLTNSLVEKLSALAEDPDRLETMSRNARAFAEQHFSIERRNRLLGEILDRANA
jgi:glycosyltransferase involved in cell wall biosynthesis